LGKRYALSSEQCSFQYRDLPDTRHNIISYIAAP
jgi:hypothetical protein